MICEDVYWKGGSIQVVPPDLERLKYREEFLVMYVIVQLVLLKEWEWKATGWISLESS